MNNEDTCYFRKFQSMWIRDTVVTPLTLEPVLNLKLS